MLNNNSSSLQWELELWYIPHSMMLISVSLSSKLHAADHSSKCAGLEVPGIGTTIGLHISHASAIA
jgi:hypothetical protein